MRIGIRSWSLWCTLLGVFVVLAGCHGPRPAIDQPLPDREIVYQTSNVLRSGSTTERRIGFVDAAGRGQTLVAIARSDISPAVEPVWTSDGNQVLFRNNYSQGLVSIAKDGTLREYSNSILRAAPTIEPSTVLLNMAYDSSHLMIALFDLGSGHVLRPFVLDEGKHETFGANALSGASLVTARWWQPGIDSDQLVYELVIRDTESHEERVLLRQEGADVEIRITSPAISPDGRQIAFTMSDGLYLIRPDGTSLQRLLPLQMVREGWLGRRWYEWPPAASWSPDSRWLVYSRCIVPAPRYCDSIAEDYAIYKLNVETLEEVLLVEGGVNPYWRLTPSSDVD